MLGWFRRAASFAAAVLVGVGAAGAAWAAPALWLVRDADSEVYLFGTLHALSRAAAGWRTPAYDEAYRRADVIWFEAEIDRADPARLGAIVQRYGIDPERPLSAKLDPSDLSRLARHADVARIDHLRPWAAALMLSMQPALGRGVSIEAGADHVLTTAARRAEKRIRTFETLEEQARMFASLTEPAEVRYLSEVIRERSGGRRLSFREEASLEQAWLDGDLARLGPGLVGEMRTRNPEFYDALLRRRNEAWAETLSAAIGGGAGVEMVNVGALHMVGDHGLPALLAARGYSVTRVQ